jgi:hypothetical protein
MQRVRRYVAVVSLFAMLGFTSNAIAARRNEDPRVRDAKKQQQTPQKSKPKGWIAKILDDLADKLSTPPG